MNMSDRVRETMSVRGILDPVLMVFLLTLATVSTANGSGSDALSLADASTPSEHEAARKAYVEYAVSARSSAAEHRTLYSRYVLQGLSIVARHCLAIASRFEEIAVSYEAMATEHANLAIATQESSKASELPRHSSP